MAWTFGNQTFGGLERLVKFEFWQGRVKLESKIFFDWIFRGFCGGCGYNLLLKYEGWEIILIFRRFRFEFNFEKNKHYA